MKLKVFLQKGVEGEIKNTIYSKIRKKKKNNST